MAPPKQDPARSSPKKPKFEQLQADHELFLQAFEKPTQIYRFLAARNKITPIFLHRSLSYLNRRCTRTNERRKTFKPDNFLETIQTKKQGSSTSCRLHGNNLQITFQELRLSKGSELLTESPPSKVEIVLLKICHRRRKNICSPTNSIHLANVEVPVLNHHDPELDTVNPCQSVTFSSASLGLNNGHRIKTFLLLFRVQCPVKSTVTLPTFPVSVSPSPKRRRLSNTTPEKGSPTPSEREHSIREYSTYFTELVLIDKQNRCQLTDGDYEVTLQEMKPKLPHFKRASWETISSSPVKSSLNSSCSNPMLKFNLSWSREEVIENGRMEEGAPEEPAPHDDISVNSHTSPGHAHTSSSSPGRQHVSPARSSLRNGQVADNNNTTPQQPSWRGGPSHRTTPTKDNPEVPKRVYYQFLYNNNLRQQTEARDNLRCPWCSVNCMELYGLLKHLTLSHSRFNFTLVPHIKGARIDVTINEHYDGSYAGNPHNLTSYTGYAFRRNGPCRRTPVTQIIVARPQRSSHDLSEFQEGEHKDYLTPRPIVSGHNRVYYHTHTLQPIRPQEMDEDSEAETDPEWMQERTKMMIDEFTDVNEGEKEVMKMWNMHCMKQNYIADSQIPTCCMKFVAEKGREILSRGLYHNFLLHLVNLYDFSLLHPQLISQIMAQLDRVKEDMINPLLTPQGPQTS
ncbi:putative polycomb protein suz12-A [Apostichopus japonicus]|uniref:Putative polycomb protein suz12-A n=1 Tax=Stichopus japonicus TaxID=307972 RepID=A0A2G8KQN4_STIJA|nr:putative polycomb protein suz12-A [Apostichopus japonicus]